MRRSRWRAVRFTEFAPLATDGAGHACPGGGGALAFANCAVHDAMLAERLPQCAGEDPSPLLVGGPGAGFEPTAKADSWTIFLERPDRDEARDDKPIRTG